MRADAAHQWSLEGASMIGQTLGHYRVLEKLGEGGPPPLASAWIRMLGELWRGLAVAQAMVRR